MKKLLLLSLSALAFFSCKDDDNKELPPVNVFDVSTGEIKHKGAAGETTFNINTEGAWTIVDTVEWATVEPLSGTGKTDIKVTFAENAPINGKERNSAIVVKTTENRERTITLKQDLGRKFPSEIIVDAQSVFLDYDANECLTRYYMKNGASETDLLRFSYNNDKKLTKVVVDTNTVNQKIYSFEYLKDNMVKMVKISKKDTIVSQYKIGANRLPDSLVQERQELKGSAPGTFVEKFEKVYAYNTNNAFAKVEKQIFAADGTTKGRLETMTYVNGDSTMLHPFCHLPAGNLYLIDRIDEDKPVVFTQIGAMVLNNKMKTETFSDFVGFWGKTETTYIYGADKYPTNAKMDISSENGTPLTHNIEIKYVVK